MTDRAKHKAQTISGLRWTVLGQSISQVTILGIGFLLMRLLPPSSFGLIGMVTVFSGFLSVFKDFGLGSSLIQKKNITKLETNSVYWFTVLLGLFLTVSLYVVSPLIARYYEEPSLTKIARVISLIFFIQSLSSVQMSLMKKQMLFKKIFIVQVSATVLSGISALVLAYNGYGVWALVLQQIISSVTVSIFIFLLKSFVPQLLFQRESLNKHLNYSLPLVGRGSLNYWSRNADNFFVGSYLGAELLGIYTRSYSFMMLPVSQISGVISSVMFPSLSKIQDDHERVLSIFLKVTRLIVFVTFPLMAMLVLGANSFVKLLFTEEWYPMIKVLQVLAIVGAFQSVATLNGNIFLVKNRTMLAFKLNILNSGALVAGFFISAQIGLIELTYTYLTISLLLLIVNWKVLASVLEIELISLFKNIAFPMICLFMIILFGSGIRLFLPSHSNYFLELFLVSIFVSLLWLLAYLVFNRFGFHEVKQALTDSVKG